MSEQNSVCIRLKPDGNRQIIRTMIFDLREEGESTTLTSAINKVVAEWVDKGAIPIKYRTK